MLTMSMKVRKKSILTILVALLMLLAIIILVLPNSRFGLGRTRKASSLDVGSLSGENNTNRISFLNHYGWKIFNEPSEVADVSIPVEFDETYTRYNELQTSQGMDLSKYKGKIVKRYSYVVQNYPNHADNIRANLLVYDKKIIACDICSLELNGFMHGLVKPK